MSKTVAHPHRFNSAPAAIPFQAADKAGKPPLQRPETADTERRCHLR